MQIASLLSRDRRYRQQTLGFRRTDRDWEAHGKLEVRDRGRFGDLDHVRIARSQARDSPGRIGRGYPPPASLALGISRPLGNFSSSGIRRAAACGARTARHTPSRGRCLRQPRFTIPAADSVWVAHFLPLFTRRSTYSSQAVAAIPPACPRRLTHVTPLCQ